MTASTPARVAVALARTRAARSLTIDEIAADADALSAHATRARRDVERQRNPEKSERAAKQIAERYGADVVARRDLDGCIIGLKFHDATFVSGFRNIFFVE